MTRATIAGGTFATMLVLLTLAVGRRARERDVDPAAATSPAMIRSETAHQGLLYGRVTTDDGAIYEGRLRWGGDEEALWGNYFNGVKDGNPWVAQVPKDRRPTEHLSLALFGREIAGWDVRADLGRPFMARLGDIARIDPSRSVVRVTLKSGAVVDLDRFSADDLADGVRVWDDRHGLVDIGEWAIRSIEFFGGTWNGATHRPLHGTVRTRQGAFTGFVQWNREEALDTDRLDGHSADGELSLPFETIRSIARRSPESALVTLLDGREIVLSSTPEVGERGRGIYVDDARYGRVLISWDAFERLDLSPGGAAPGYGDFPPGRPLTGSVVTRSGRRLAGRLVYDLDESETTETLDAPSEGVDYTILFGLIASIVIPGVEEGGTSHARVRLHSGEVLELERAGDLGELNAGILVFTDSDQRPEYVPWADVDQIHFERATYPTSGASVK
jgi:hypothetical protein